MKLKCPNCDGKVFSKLYDYVKTLINEKGEEIPGERVYEYRCETCGSYDVEDTE